MEDGARVRTDPASVMADALEALAAHLRAEVQFTRATRGPDRTEEFLGLFMSETEADALTAELIRKIKAGALPGRDEIEARWRAVTAARSAAPDGIWRRLATGFTLGEIELDLLLLAAAPALDPRFGRVYGFLNDDMARRHLTPALCLRLLAPRGLDAVSLHRLLSASGPLRRFGLVHLAEARPFIERPLRIDDRLVTRLIGDEAAQDLLMRRFWLLDTADAPRACAPPPAWFIDTGSGDPGPRVLNMAAGQGWRIALLRLDGLAGDARLETLRLGLREARLLKALPIVTGLGDPDAELAALLATGALAVLDAPGGWLEAGLGAAPLPAAQALDRPGLTLDRTGWLDRLLGDDPRRAIAGEAGHLGVLELIVQCLRHGDAATLQAAIGAGRAGPFGPLARLSWPATSLDDMVLCARGRGALNDFIDRRRSTQKVLVEWGLGASFGKTNGAAVLFRGPPGTGKTMAAGAVASALGLPLVRIDLSGLVSKFIGETEKNLERVFCAAESISALLFFDEADSLFGRRSDVSDAHDRYANLETSYLLQRLETFTGVAVLASNLHQNIDEAFLRRLDLIVDFPVPAAAERLALWRRIEATRAPLADDVDLETLAARFELTGGEIRNCWIDAAHRAARADTAITMRQLVEAVGRELIKQGRPIRKSEFGEHFALVRAGGTP